MESCHCRKAGNTAGTTTGNFISSIITQRKPPGSTQETGNLPSKNKIQAGFLSVGWVCMCVYFVCALLWKNIARWLCCHRLENMREFSKLLWLSWYSYILHSSIYTFLNLICACSVATRWLRRRQAVCDFSATLIIAKVCRVSAR